jgi:hypothetical protein
MNTDEKDIFLAALTGLLASGNAGARDTRSRFFTIMNAKKFASESCVNGVFQPLTAKD